MFTLYSERKQNLSLILYVLPAFLVYAVFKLFPAFSGLFYAMTDWNGINKSYNFIGLSNFAEVFLDEYFLNSMVFTTKYVVVMIIVANLSALALALAIESLTRGRGLFRTLFYMPNIISMVIGGYIWRFIFHKVLYYLADNWGWYFLDHSWVGDTRYAFLSIIIVAAWGSVGYLMIIYLAALQGIPQSLIEAGALDGAKPWQMFWHITCPMIRPALTICLFWTLNSSYQVFDVVFSLTGGGPGRATQSVALNIYEEAFKGNIRFGYSTAKSTVLFLVIFIITAIQIQVMKKREEEL